MLSVLLLALSAQAYADQTEVNRKPAIDPDRPVFTEALEESEIGAEVWDQAALAIDPELDSVN